MPRVKSAHSQVSVNGLAEVEPLRRLHRDLVAAHATLTSHEARFLVDAYYAQQDNRKRANSQVKSLERSGEPHEVIQWVLNSSKMIEKAIKRTLDPWTLRFPEGQWARGIRGIGPVLTAGLLAHIDINKAPTVGHIWRFAGLDPTDLWQKGEARPWNADLKTLCWKVGESFVKVCNRDDDVYGKIYIARKALEISRNERHEFADQAAAILKAKNFFRDTTAKAAYEQGLLPDGHIHARAKRYAVKIFLSHLHHVMYEVAFNTPPPKPYILTHPEVDPRHAQHVHFLSPPYWPLSSQVVTVTQSHEVEDDPEDVAEDDAG